MRPIIYPYKRGSRSARALSQHLRDLRGKRVRESGNYKPYRNHLIINWGNPRLPIWFRPIGHWLNRPDRVAIAGNKLSTFHVLHNSGVPIPEYRTNRTMVPEEWELVVCRHMLRASGGDGIQLVYTREEELPPSMLFTRYEKKKHEFRVHVFGNEVIDIQQKRKRRDVEADYQVRNYERGWVFCRQEVDLPKPCYDAAFSAIQALELDFGAVDIGWNEHYQRATVYEVNTAPGLEGTTLDNYLNAIRRTL